METELPFPKERLASESRAQQRWKPRSGGTAEAEWAEMKQRLASAEGEGRATRRLLLTLFGLGVAAMTGINWLTTTRLATVLSESNPIKAPLQVADAQGHILLRVDAINDRIQVRLFDPSGKPVASWDGDKHSVAPMASHPVTTRTATSAGAEERQPAATLAGKPAALPPAKKSAGGTTDHAKTGRTIAATIGTAARGPAQHASQRSGASQDKARAATAHKQLHGSAPHPGHKQLASRPSHRRSPGAFVQPRRRWGRYAWKSGTWQRPGQRQYHGGFRRAGHFARHRDGRSWYTHSRSGWSAHHSSGAWAYHAADRRGKRWGSHRLPPGRRHRWGKAK